MNQPLELYHHFFSLLIIKFSYRAYLSECAVKEPATKDGQDLDGKLRL
jgi:hypothetical protein